MNEKKRQPQKEEFCASLKGEEFLNKYNEFRSQGRTMQYMADYWGISKYTLRKVLKDKFNIIFKPGKPVKPYKFKDEI